MMNSNRLRVQRRSASGSATGIAARAGSISPSSDTKGDADTTLDAFLKSARPRLQQKFSFGKPPRSPESPSLHQLERTPSPSSGTNESLESETFGAGAPGGNKESNLSTREKYPHLTNSGFDYRLDFSSVKYEYRPDPHTVWNESTDAKCTYRKAGGGQRSSRRQSSRMTQESEEVEDEKEGKEQATDSDHTETAIVTYLSACRELNATVSPKVLNILQQGNSIEFVYTALPNNQFQAIGSGISKCESIKHATFHECIPSDDVAAHLIAGLGGVDMIIDEWESTVATAKSGNYLQSLDLSQNKALSARSLSALGRILLASVRCQQSLVHLDLRDCPCLFARPSTLGKTYNLSFYQKSFDKFVDNLSKCSQIQHLDIADCDLCFDLDPKKKCDGTLRLLRSIMNLPQLRTLNVSRNKFSLGLCCISLRILGLTLTEQLLDDIQAVYTRAQKARSASTDMSLQFGSKSKTIVTAFLRKLFAEGASGNQCILQNLYMEDCNLSDEALAFLGTAMQLAHKSADLKEVDLSRNQLTSRACSSVTTMIMSSRKLNEINLSYNSLNYNAIETIISSLEHNTSVLSINLSGSLKSCEQKTEGITPNFDYDSKVEELLYKLESVLENRGQRCYVQIEDAPKIRFLSPGRVPITGDDGNEQAIQKEVQNLWELRQRQSTTSNLYDTSSFLLNLLQRDLEKSTYDVLRLEMLTDRTKHVLERHYPAFREIFRYHSFSSKCVEYNPFVLSFAEYSQFCKISGLQSAVGSPSKLDVAFLAALKSTNAERTEGSQTGLSRHGFLEVLLRLALLTSGADKNDEELLATSFDNFFEEFVERTAREIFDTSNNWQPWSDIFREKCLYTNLVGYVFVRMGPTLKDIFLKSSGSATGITDMETVSEGLAMKDWRRVLETAGLLKEVKTKNRTEAAFMAFGFSLLARVEEPENPRQCQATYTEFLEAICRFAVLLDLLGLQKIIASIPHSQQDTIEECIYDPLIQESIGPFLQSRTSVGRANSVSEPAGTEKPDDVSIAELWNEAPKSLNKLCAKIFYLSICIALTIGVHIRTNMQE